MDIIQPVVEIGDDKIYPLIFTPESIETFWFKAQQFPIIFGQQILGDIEAFLKVFFDVDEYGRHKAKGLFWVLNPEDFTGLFYMNHIQPEIDAQVHYTFFDRRHRGRAPLVRALFKYGFERYNFQRLSTEIPNYATPQARRFAQECGMSYEGKRRQAAFYKDTWFDVNLYGILKSEVLK